jgi:trigger factor
MKTNVQKIKDCRVRISVEVGADRVEERYREVLRDFQREATLPGFRQGKAPADLVEKKFAKEAEEETVKSLVPEAYHQSLAKHNVAAVTPPKITDVKYQRGKALSFTAEFESAPDVPVKNYKGIKLKKVGAEVADAEVDKAMASLAESKADMTPVAEDRPVRAGDFIETDIEYFRDGSYQPGKKGVLLYADAKHESDDDFLEKVVGARVNEVREITVGLSAEDREKGLVGRRPFCKVWIRGIREKKLPEVNDDFAKLFGQPDVEALRQAVRRDLARHKAGESQEEMKKELFEKLLGTASFALPEGLVESQKERLVEQARRQYAHLGVSPDRFEKELESVRREAAGKASEQVKLYFILQAIAEKEGIEADEMEIEQRLNALAEESKRPLDEVRQMFEDDLRESMREKKTIDFLLANAKFDEANA